MVVLDTQIFRKVRTDKLERALKALLAKTELDYLPDLFREYHPIDIFEDDWFPRAASVVMIDCMHDLCRKEATLKKALIFMYPVDEEQQKVTEFWFMMAGISPTRYRQRVIASIREELVVRSRRVAVA